MGIMVYSLLWVMQDFVHQPYFKRCTAATSNPQHAWGRMRLNTCSSFRKLDVSRHDFATTCIGDSLPLAMFEIFTLLYRILKQTLIRACTASAINYVPDIERSRALRACFKARP